MRSTTCSTFEQNPITTIVENRLSRYSHGTGPVCQVVATQINPSVMPIILVQNIDIMMISSRLSKLRGPTSPAADIFGCMFPKCGAPRTSNTPQRGRGLDATRW